MTNETSCLDPIRVELARLKAEHAGRAAAIDTLEKVLENAEPAKTATAETAPVRKTKPKGKPRAKPQSKSNGAEKAETRNYIRFANPDNLEETYERGPLPPWLKEKMTAQGFDPGDKLAREKFKREHLLPVT